MRAHGLFDAAVGRFEEFWRACPRRVGKDAARKAYGNAVLNKRASEDELLAGMLRFAQKIAADGTEERFVCHPATWLNQGRWSDEPMIGRRREVFKNGFAGIVASGMDHDD